MPRRQKTDQEKQLEQQVAALIQNIKGSNEPKIDVARALSLFERAAKYQEQALAILRGEEVTNEPAPGKNRVGRPSKVAESTDFEAAGEPAAPAPTPRSKSKKQAPIAPENA